MLPQLVAHSRAQASRSATQGARLHWAFVLSGEDGDEAKASYKSLPLPYIHSHTTGQNSWLLPLIEASSPSKIRWI